MSKINPKDIIREISNVQSVALPADWFDDIPEDQTVFHSLYHWMLTGGRVTENIRNTIHDRTYVGEKLFRKLIAVEKKRIKKTRGLKGDELETAAAWSDLGNGPQNKIGECTIIGDVLLVIPESSKEEYHDFSLKIHNRIFEEEIKRIKKYAAGASFYEWLISQKERPDLVGDLAQDIYNDKNFPKDIIHFEEIKNYLESEGGFSGVIDAIKIGWFEYIQQYPERIKPSAWCSECSKKIELDEALLAYDTDFLELYVLDKQCLDSFTKFGGFSSRPLQDISPLVLEELYEKEGVIQYDIQEIIEQLKLWGVIPITNENGCVYFIKSEKTDEIKIGYTSGEVKNRLRSLQTGHPYKLKILATLSGTRDDERSLHEKFANSRLKGEWFKSHPDLLDIISIIRKS